MWICHDLILQAVMREAEITCDIDGNDWKSHISTVGTMFCGTCLWWTGKEMTWFG